MIRRGRKKMFGHFDTHQVWSIIEVSRGFWPPWPKHLGQQFTILQTFWPFGYDIFKIPKRQNHLDSSITWWLWLRPKYLGQRYTMLQTFRPFGYDIFKIPKCHNQLRFWFKLARVAWYHVSARVWSIIEVPRRFWPPRVHRNSHITSVSSSNLRRPLGIMYHMVIHDSKHWAQVWRPIEGFPRVLSHPGRHTGPRQNTFFGFQTRENTYRSEKQF